MWLVFDGCFCRPELMPEAGWYVMGDAKAHVIAFGAKNVSPLAVLDALGKKGWHLAGLQEPNGELVFGYF